MVRLAVSGQRVVFDEAQRLPGRGGYLHLQPRCWEKFVKSKRKKPFASLKRALSHAEREQLVEALQNRSEKSAAVAEDRSNRL